MGCWDSPKKKPLDIPTQTECLQLCTIARERFFGYTNELLPWIIYFFAVLKMFQMALLYSAIMSNEAWIFLFLDSFRHTQRTVVCVFTLPTPHSAWLHRNCNVRICVCLFTLVNESWLLCYDKEHFFLLFRLNGEGGKGATWHSISLHRTQHRRLWCSRFTRIATTAMLSPIGIDSFSSFFF